MRIVYKYDDKKLTLQETPNGDDIEFSICLHEPEFKKRLVQIREYFNANNISTDILVYTHPNHKYQIIVRKDFYEDFLLQLFKHCLLEEMKWVKNGA